VTVPRFSLAAIGIAVLVIAIDLAVVRVALFGPDSEYWAIFALYLLPMFDALLISLYRLRRREYRSAGTVGFLFAGLSGTLAVFTFCLIRPDTAWAILRAGDRLILLSNIHELTRVFGNAVMQSGAMELVLGVTEEILFPIAFLCAATLFVAFLGGWLAGRVGTRRPIACGSRTSRTVRNA
jgi:hypothetical protein